MIAEPESEKTKTSVKSDKVEGGAEKEWPTTYDGKKREPEYANAQNSCLWELVSFQFSVEALSRSLTTPCLLL
jgi:ribosome biogenesis protein MAK21